MSNSLKPKGRKNSLVLQEIKSEILIYDLNADKAFCLNETSALIWHLCDGEKSVSEISRELSNKFKRPVNEDLIWFALDELKKENLLADDFEIHTKFDGMSRREVIRKIGIASVIALPVISSLAAPHAVAAQSCLSTGQDAALGQTCNNPDPVVCQNGCNINSVRCCSNTATISGTCPNCTCVCA